MAAGHYPPAMMTRKEVKMSGKIRIYGLVFGAVLIALFAEISLGQASKDPCGGHYVGQGLKAKFLNWYTENGITYESNIINDLEGVWYQYQVPGGDCIFLFRRGHIIAGIEGYSGRSVAMHFDQTKTIVVPDFMKDLLIFPGKTQQRWKLIDGQWQLVNVDFERAIKFKMKLAYKSAATRNDPNYPGELVLTGAGFGLNFGEMTPGETLYCADGVTFTIEGDPLEYAFNSQVKVYYGELSEGGLGWEVTPIHEFFWFLTYKKVWIDKKNYILIPEYTPQNTSLYQGISSDTCDDYGEFYFPFKLILQRK